MTVKRQLDSWVIRAALLAAVLMLGACQTQALREDIVQHEPSYASAPAQYGLLWQLAAGITDTHGEQYSGFRLLDKSLDGLNARLALIDSAVSSLDIQTYLWYADRSGSLLMERLIHAADRGVRVRLIVDDLMTLGEDQLIYELDRHPNIEFRLFNPWKQRSVAARAGEIIADMEHMNHRMHDKLLVADGQAVIIGGRNIGDHYFGLNDKYNFHDLDVLGFGQVARQANGMFDHFWNSDWVVSADNLGAEPDPDYARQAWADLQRTNRATPELASFSIEPRDWSVDVAKLVGQMHVGTSVILYDSIGREGIEQDMAAEIFDFMGLAREELLVTNAYIIPSQHSIDFLDELTARGVRVRVLTNSLASNDVPAVNSHYRGWRDDLIEAGVDLYEMRADPAITSLVDVPPVTTSFTGLHSKGVVVDRRMVFIGSLNFDPRSFNINTEDGVFILSRGLAEGLAAVMERDMQPENAWRVQLDEAGKTYWQNSDETVRRQPARGFFQRVMDIFFKLFPKEQY